MTTVVDLSVPYENWLDLAEQSGLRVVIAPMYRSARWFTKTGHSVEYEWAEDDGRGVLGDGVIMNTFGRYLRNGIPMGIGTDTYPHNMLEEIRHALINSRIISKNPYDLRTTDAFDAATTGGAAVLGMDDIGKLAPGMKSDLFLADISHRAMRPLRDPLASLIYVAGERAVTDTFVDGKPLVRDGVLTTFDLDDALDGLEAAQARAAEAFQTLDFGNRTHD